MMTNGTKEKVIKAMKLLKEACSEASEWSDCNDCPFDEYCDCIALTKKDIYSPAEFEF